MVFENKQAKAKYLKIVFDTCASHPSVTAKGRAETLFHLSVPVEKTEITNIPAAVLGNIWSKAERILQTPNSILRYSWHVKCQMCG